VRGIDTKAVAVHINSTWDGPDGFEVKKLLKIDDTPDNKSKKPDGIPPSANTTGKAFVANAPEPVKAHFNVLAQSMLLVPGALSGLVLDALVGLDGETLFAMSKDPIVSRTLQTAITTRTASIITVRKLVQHFYGHMGEMALDKAASHVVDCIWEGTHGLAFIRERIAEELAENEAQLRESPCGKTGKWTCTRGDAETGCGRARTRLRTMASRVFPSWRILKVMVRRRSIRRSRRWSWRGNDTRRTRRRRRVGRISPRRNRKAVGGLLAVEAQRALGQIRRLWRRSEG
jgi:hypothetical protein